MKDPALLWYFNDWMGGTATMSRHLKGCYMDLLCVQFNSGALSLDEIKTVLGSDFGSWPALQKKFKCENGLYFNERLMNEKDKRSSFTESRRKSSLSRFKDHHTMDRMEDINEDRNTIKNKYGEFQKVLLTESDYLKLISRFGEPNTAILITELDGYIKSLGKDKYKDHYATLQNWGRRKIANHIEKRTLSTKTRTIA